MEASTPTQDAAAGEPAQQLGAFLRAARERLQPQSVGLPAGRRRRTQGLRREEVAALCSISPTWYTWIEQGRTQAVSVATLDALAQGLRLSAAERAYLFELARRADPRTLPAAHDAQDDQAYAGLVHALRCPAYALDRRWDLLDFNAEAARLFAPWLGRPAPAEPNLLRWVYLDPAARAWIVDWPVRARRLAAEFRADTAQLRDDARHREFVATLCAQSPEFEKAWLSQQVLEREGGLRGFMTPGGPSSYHQFTLRAAAHADLRLIVLRPLDATEPVVTLG